MVIIDPTNENLALNEKGEILGAFRVAPAGTPPEEMKDAPIIGYGNPFPIKQDSWDDPLIA